MLLKDIPYSQESADSIKELLFQGKVVFVLPFKSSLLSLAIVQSAKEMGLPHDAKIIHLRRPSTLLTSKETPSADPLAQLIEEQKNSDQPIFAIPHLLVMGRRRATAGKSAVDLVFGTRDAPGFIRLLIRLIVLKGQAQWQVGEPLNLKETKTAAPGIKLSLRKQFRRLESTHVGPKAKSYERIRNETLRDGALTAYIKTMSNDTGVPLKDLYKKSRRYFNEIAANFDGDFIRLLDVILGFVFNRIYDGISWNSAEIAALRKASLKGPIILLPTHKSHMDYLVLSYVLYREGLMCPHIAAGANLSFFPLGPIFRRGGAYFIRRQFKDDPLYAKVVRAYLNRLLKEGFTQEFFIEGGRTRTGKTLSPKLGLLSIYIDCLCSDRFQDAVFVPASISYERIVESQSYDEEQAGKAKTKESAKSLISSSQVLLKRFGRVFVSFDKPVILSEFMESRNFAYPNANEDERRRFAKSLAHQVVIGMNQSVVVTPAAIIALVLLSSKTRALRENRFLAQTLDVLGLLQAIYPEIRLSDALANDTEQSLETALALLAQDGQIVKKHSKNLSYVLAPAKKARALNFYKNTIIHFFVNDALIACAFIAECASKQSLEASLEAVKLRVRLLSQILKFEFVFPVELSLDQVFAQRIAFLKTRHIFEDIESKLVLSSSKQAKEDLDFLSRMLQPFFETYFVVFDDALSDSSRKLNEKDFTALALKHLSEGLQSGLITRPEAVNKPSCEFALQSIKSFASNVDTLPSKEALLEPFKAIADVLDALD